jgi:hypothetical protein
MVTKKPKAYRAAEPHQLKYHPLLLFDNRFGGFKQHYIIFLSFRVIYIGICIMHEANRKISQQEMT